MHMYAVEGRCRALDQGLNLVVWKTCEFLYIIIFREFRKVLCPFIGRGVSMTLGLSLLGRNID
jgi:hypothetical protein